MYYKTAGALRVVAVSGNRFLLSLYFFNKRHHHGLFIVLRLPSRALPPRDRCNVDINQTVCLLWPVFHALTNAHAYSLDVKTGGLSAAAVLPLSISGLLALSLSFPFLPLSFPHAFLSACCAGPSSRLGFSCWPWAETPAILAWRGKGKTSHVL